MGTGLIILFGIAVVCLGIERFATGRRWAGVWTAFGGVAVALGGSVTTFDWPT